MEKTKEFIEEMNWTFKYILDQKPIEEVKKKERRFELMVEIFNEQTGEVFNADMSKLLFDSSLNMYKFNPHSGEAKYIDDTKGFAARFKS